MGSNLEMRSRENKHPGFRDQHLHLDFSHVCQITADVYTTAPQNNDHQSSRKAYLAN